MPAGSRAMLLLALVALAGGLARSLARPAGPDRSWTRQPGVPVELVGDGVYFVARPATIARLLARAGHACPAVGSGVLRAGDRVRIERGCRTHVGRMAGWARRTLGLRLDVDEDDAAALAALPGVGRRLASAIVEDRARRGPFGSLEALERVRGIGPATVRGLRRFATAAGTTR